MIRQKKKKVTTAYRYVKVDIEKNKQTKEKRKEKYFETRFAYARITDLSFTVVIQFYRIFLEFSHQVICCHKSEVFVT